SKTVWGREAPRERAPACGSNLPFGLKWTVPSARLTHSMAGSCRRRVILICGLLGALILGAFWPALNNGFVLYADPVYVTQNPQVSSGLNWASVAWAWRTGHGGNWHPLTWLSHMLDVQLFGLNPWGHHLTSLLLHLANTLLLFLVLRRMTGTVWPSALVAALFGLHPLRVESVAWVAERKDVLSGFFFLLTLLAYHSYVDRRSTQHARPYYFLALILFALGLLSKPMLVTLPFVLLLLDFWPLERTDLGRAGSGLGSFRPLLVEKVPFLALSLASCLVT